MSRGLALLLATLLTGCVAGLGEHGPKPAPLPEIHSAAPAPGSSGCPATGPGAARTGSGCRGGGSRRLRCPSSREPLPHCRRGRLVLLRPCVPPRTDRRPPQAPWITSRRAASTRRSSRPGPTTIGVDRDSRNRLPGLVEPPYPGDVARRARRGVGRPRRAPRAGRRGAAPRRGRALPARGRDGDAHGRRREGARRRAARAHSFLDLRLGENAHVSRRRRAAAAALDDDQRGHRRADPARRSATGSTRELPHDLRAVRLAAPHARRARSSATSTASPSVYATGHGDLPDALRASGLLAALPRPRRQDGVDRQHRQPRRHGRSRSCSASTSRTAARSPWSSSTRSGAIAAAARCAGTGGPSSRRSSASRSASTRRRVPVFNTNTFLVDARGARRRSRWSGPTSRSRRRSATAAPCSSSASSARSPSALEPRFLRVPRAGRGLALPPGQGRRRARAAPPGDRAHRPRARDDPGALRRRMAPVPSGRPPHPSSPPCPSRSAVQAPSPRAPRARRGRDAARPRPRRAPPTRCPTRARASRTPTTPRPSR